MKFSGYGCRNYEFQGIGGSYEWQYQEQTFVVYGCDRVGGYGCDRVGGCGCDRVGGYGCDRVGGCGCDRVGGY
ncbi:unnamed protein product, partial [Rotaria sordida]